LVKIDDIYLVTSTIAITHESPSDKGVNIKDLEQFLSPPINIGVTPEGTMVSSQRDQIEIVTSNVRTNVRDLSGKKDFVGSKIGVILNWFVTNFELKINSYGINFILRVSYSNPRQWISENILSSRISERTGNKLTGGAALISLDANPKTLNIKLEPVDGDKLAVDFNASEKTNTLPAADILCSELKTQWELLAKLLSNLGL
jgi:hypothetical protein